MPWRDQLADKSIDAIIAVAPPEVTTEVAMACAAAGKPVMATKPLFDHPERITAPFYVDFWRLWSEAHQAAKESGVFAGYFLYGTGPARSFPGVLDYGPHVMAAVLDFDPSATVDTVVNMGNRGGPPGAETFSVDFEASSGDRMRSWFGNGGPHSGRTIWGETETPTHIGAEPKEAIMQKFCRAFMADVSEGFVSTTLLDYSRDGMRLLREIRERAK